MIIGVLGEADGERRVVVLPEVIATLKQWGVSEVLVEEGAGDRAFASNEAYLEAGAQLASRNDVLARSNLMLGIQGPTTAELNQTAPDATIIAQFNALGELDKAEALRQSGRSIFSMDLIPRTTRAQSMDVLSSMATIAGNRAVLQAALSLPKFFPMFMTAAGSIKPAAVLVLGAGVAGLQAIATARRLGGVVEAFDVRSAVREEVQSLGAKFVEVEGAVEDQGAGGYAVEQSEAYKKLQAEAIQRHAAKSDVVICTAQIPGRPAPKLIEEDTLKQMRNGSVVVDLAASSGGNCAMTVDGQTIVAHGVTLIGDSNMPSGMPSDASKMFGKNVQNFLKLIIMGGELNLNFEDDIVHGTCLCHAGEYYNTRLRQSIGVDA